MHCCETNLCQKDCVSLEHTFGLVREAPMLILDCKWRTHNAWARNSKLFTSKTSFHCGSSVLKRPHVFNCSGLFLFPDSAICDFVRRKRQNELFSSQAHGATCPIDNLPCPEPCLWQASTWPNWPEDRTERPYEMRDPDGGHILQRLSTPVSGCVL